MQDAICISRRPSVEVDEPLLPSVRNTEGAHEAGWTDTCEDAAQDLPPIGAPADAARGAATATTPSGRWKCLNCSSWLSWFGYGLFLVWSWRFVVYVVLVYLAQPRSTWDEPLDGRSHYTESPRFIAIHWVGGAIINLLGPVQMLPWVRRRAVKLHKVCGYVYASACLLTSVGGCTYILTTGCVGGLSMDVAFFIYGVGLAACALQTVYHAAVARDVAAHREWALRLLTAGFASGWYRVLIVGIALFVTPEHRTVVPAPGSGGRDYVVEYLRAIAWLFFLPNMAAVEVVIRRARARRKAAAAAAPPNTPDRVPAQELPLAMATL